ncbi:chaperone NapD [Vibrio misgurnus]|uniref:chaperone NapD n=1 Tax=Vibrio TaxID=662 RepID=UPI002416D06F|nr:chaperone NapD [Vibrio sp. gvc]
MSLPLDSLHEIHISSLVIHTLPEHLATVKQQISQLADVEIYGEDPQGKLVVVVETERQGFITETIEHINHLPNVLNAFLVFHQVESAEEDEL